MDEVVNRLAREVVDAISAAVASDPRVEACREKARAEGYDLRISLEAIIGFAGRTAGGAGARASSRTRRGEPARAFEMNANDRRFLRSLRIAVDEQAEKEVD
jgi:hypothetical protein